MTDTENAEIQTIVRRRPPWLPAALPMRRGMILWMRSALVVALLSHASAFLTTRGHTFYTRRSAENISDAQPQDDGPSQSLLDNFRRAIESQELASFTIRGPQMVTSKNKESLRGTLRMVTGRTVHIAKIPKIHVSFKYHSATDIVKNWETTDCTSNVESILLGRIP